MRSDNGLYERELKRRKLPESFTQVFVSPGQLIMLTILSDFEKTFIQAVIFNYDVIKEYGDESNVKAAGKVMTKGKDYEMVDGDIMLVKAGAAKG